MAPTTGYLVESRLDVDRFWRSRLTPPRGRRIVRPASRCLIQTNPFCSINRDYFETLLRLRLGSTDLLSIPEYYGAHMSILEYKGEAIGLVAVDYQKPGENLESVIDGARKEDVEGGLGLGWLMGRGKKDEGQSVKDVASSATTSATDSKSSLKSRKQPLTVPADPSGPIARKSNHLKGTTAHIRHLYVDAPYRGRGLEQDLLRHAISEAFTQSAIRRVIVSIPSYAPSALTTLLRRMSFVTVAQGDDAIVPGTPGHEEAQGIMVKDTREFGVFGWRVVGWSGKWLEITRAQWEAWKAKQRDE